MAPQTTTLPQIDVRTVQPRERDPRIFAMVGELSRGESFLIINDHDPRPLRRQLDSAYPDEFSWTYLEAGPDVWRVELARRAA